MKSGNIRAVQKLLGHRSIYTAGIYSHLSERHLHHIIHLLPNPDLNKPAILTGKGITQVVDIKVAGDTGFEPVTCTSLVDKGDINIASGIQIEANTVPLIVE